jgi:hypothetical protein
VLNYNLIPDLWKTISRFPKADWNDALSSGQIQSKMWLIETAEQELPHSFSCAFICAGWYGLLAGLWKQRPQCPLKKIRSFDIDPECTMIADHLHKLLVMNDWEFKASTHDILNLNYTTAHYTTFKSNGESQALVDSPDLIINTSCEHLPDFQQWLALIPKNTWIILQNNNFFQGEGHVNCSNSEDDFANMAQLSNLKFKGTLDLKHYKRFMLIGQK